MMKPTPLRTKGFSLLELLLSVTIFAGLLMAVFNMMQYFSQRELARATNKYMTVVADATSQILNNVDNFNTLYAAAVANGGVYTLTADTAASAPAQDNIAKTFQIGSVTIQRSRLFNQSFRGANSPLRTPISILLRVANDPAGKKGFDILVVTDNPRNDTIVRMAASMAGEAGGIVREYPNKSAASITHSYGSWDIPLSTLSTSAWYGSLPSPLDANNDGSFLVYYRYANLEDKTGDYLYRTPQTDAGLNTMYGSFNIGGNDIVGADDLTIGDHANSSDFSASDPVPAPTDCLNSKLCVNGTAALKGSGTIGGNMITHGSALVADSMNAREVKIHNGLASDALRQEYRAENLMVVDGEDNVNDTIEIGNTAHFVDGGTVQNATFQSISNVNATLPEGGVINAGTLTNNRRITSSSISVNQLSVDDQLKAGKVLSGPATVTGRTGTIDITNATDLQYGSDANPRVITTPVMHARSLKVDSFGTCTSGCGQ